MLVILIFSLLRDACGWKAPLIDEDGNYFDKFDFSKVEKEVSIVSIIGPQSSGKSTILNALFKTNFDVMNETLGMPQTTKGIWIGNAIPPNYTNVLNLDLLVLDVQGFDSREREDVNGETYDNRAGLFVVSMSNVIIFNMWMNEVNRYRGGGTTIIRNIFQNAVNLNLSTGKTGKKTLIFLVQNYKSRVSLSLLKETIYKNLKDSWGKVENSSNISLDSLFNIIVYPLPHVLLPETNEVNESVVKDLREMFFNPKHLAFLHSLDTERFPNVTGVIETGKKIWEIIMDNKDLEVSPLLEDYRRVIAEWKKQKAIEEAEAEAKAQKEIDEQRRKKTLDDAEALRKFKNQIDTIRKPFVISQRSHRTLKTHRHKRGKYHNPFPRWDWTNEECDCYDGTIITTIYEMQYEITKVFEDGHTEPGGYEDAPRKETHDHIFEPELNHCNRNCQEL